MSDREQQAPASVGVMETGAKRPGEPDDPASVDGDPGFDGEGGFDGEPDFNGEPTGETDTVADRRRTATRHSDLDTLINTYPGPACWLRGDGSLRAASPMLRRMPFGEAGDGWWETLMVDLARLSDESEPLLVSEVPYSGQRRTFYWVPTHLPDGSIVLTGRDATTESNLRKALVESRQRFRELSGIAADFAWETDRDGNFVYVSPEGALGYPAASLVGTSADRLLAEDSELSQSPFRVRRPVRHIDVALRRVDGEVVWVSLSARPAYDTAGRPIGVRGLWQEVTASRIRDAEIARAQTRDRLLVHLGSVLRDAGGPDDRLDEVAETIARSVGGSMVLLLRRAGDGTVSAPGRFRAPDLAGLEDFAMGSMEIRQTLADLDAQVGEERVLRLDRDDSHLTIVPTRFRQRINGALLIGVPPSRAPIPAGDVETLFAIAGQLGLANSNALFIEQLRYQAERDELCGLYNRRAFIRFLDERLAAGDNGALVFVDLNHFKLVNDRLGHQRGDDLLRGVADRLVEMVQPGDRAARIGGDEFLLWLADRSPARLATLSAALSELVPSVMTPEEADRTGFGLAVGIVWRAAQEGVDALIARADNLMYRAKAGAKAQANSNTMIVMDDAPQSSP